MHHFAPAGLDWPETAINVQRNTHDYKKGTALPGTGEASQQLRTKVKAHATAA